MGRQHYQSVHLAAQQCRAVGLDNAHLCTPFSGPDELGQISQFSPLLLWHRFYPPVPPSAESLILIDIPSSDDCLLVYRIILPLGSYSRVYGMIPNDVSLDRNALLITMNTLVDRNGSEDMAIFEERPTAVHVDADGLLLDEPEQHDLFRRALSVIDPGNLDSDIDYLRRYRGDPWARVEAALRASMPIFLNADNRTASVSKNKTDNSDSQFDQWWSLVTDPLHVQSEAEAIKRAWRNMRDLHYSEGHE